MELMVLGTVDIADRVAKETVGVADGVAEETVEARGVLFVV
jgi:hypothetical protein